MPRDAHCLSDTSSRFDVNILSTSRKDKPLLLPDCLYSLTSLKQIRQLDDEEQQDGDSLNELYATVYYKGNLCTLSFCEATDKLVLATKPLTSSSSRVLLSIPMHTLLNAETADERAVREFQRRKQAKPNTLQFSRLPLLQFFSFLAPPLGIKFSDLRRFAHTLSENVVDLLRYTELCYNNKRHYTLVWLQKTIQSNFDACSYENVAGRDHKHFSDGHVSQRGPRAKGRGGQPRLAQYFIHYLLTNQSLSRQSIRTLEFCVPEDSHCLDQAQKLVSAVLRRVYGSGPKTLEFFISPKSGKGRGEIIFKSKLKPVLDLCRHKTTITVTNRAHECEDYIADLKNTLDENYVVVAVGGDGMVHEIVNGLHRRRLALIACMRKECQAAELEGAAVDVSRASAVGAESGRNVLATEDCGTGNEGGLHSESFVASTACYNLSAESSRSSPTPIFDAFLRQGWDVFMPFVATVPCGSGCGLAMALDVLNLTKAALALIQLSSCRLSLLKLKFKRNADLYNFHWNSWSKRKRAVANKSFASYRERYGKEIDEQLGQNKKSVGLSASCLMDSKLIKVDSQDSGLGIEPVENSTGLVNSVPHLAESNLSLSSKGLTSFESRSPFFKDGTSLYTDAVSHTLGAPEFEERVGFMSLSFGMPNDIDRGSEPLRWMGNARFSVFGAFLLLSGVRKYKAKIRYLPWVDEKGQKRKNLDEKGNLTSSAYFPTCTMRNNCPHCERYAEPSLSGLELLKRSKRNILGQAKGKSKNSVNASEGDDGVAGAGGSRMDHANAPDRGFTSSSPTTTSAERQMLLSTNDVHLLREDDVDFDCERLPWVTIEDEFVAIVLCNVANLARDILMAPFSHLSDGAIDIVFYRSSLNNKPDINVSRKDIYHFFNGFKDGTHLRHPCALYVKARAIQIKLDSGICMADGEMMPLSSVQVTKILDAVRIVRFL